MAPDPVGRAKAALFDACGAVPELPAEAVLDRPFRGVRGGLVVARAGGSGAPFELGGELAQVRRLISSAGELLERAPGERAGQLEVADDVGVSRADRLL